MLMLDIKYAFLLSIFVGFSLCEDEWPKVITDITKDVERNIGENVTLSCYVHNPDSHLVSWVKKNRDNPSQQTTLSYGATLAFKHPRFAVTATENSFSLQIQNIEYSDDAVYECAVTISDTYKDSRIVNLLITHPPKIIREIEINPNPAPLNSSVELKCNSEGYPMPSITWTRAENALIPAKELNSRILRINNVSQQDRGIYNCIADNKIGQPVQSSVNFAVEFPPKISTPRPRIAQATNYDIELECKVEGYPAPQVVWYKDDSEILTEGDYSITNMAQNNDITISILRITSVESGQYGDYVCKALNKLGSAEAKIELFLSAVAVYPWQTFGRN